MESLSFEQVQIILLANSDKKKIPSPSSSVKHLKTLRVKAKVNLRTWIEHGVPERAWIHMLRSKTSLIHEYSLQKQKVIVLVIPPTSSRVFGSNVEARNTLPGCTWQNDGLYSDNDVTAPDTSLPTQLLLESLEEIYYTHQLQKEFTEKPHPMSFLRLLQHWAATTH
ncbi:hypothetical protein OUZ56_005364 [Daphnia magna]|uniref:Uncharacterized protein n=1 Tax=Daphnia magna TaxID=35525 RepID=A0ABQ9YSK5_9CRUS|nr:hypothetical protein OUZ56_005364 [Daphnia magna]